MYEPCCMNCHARSAISANWAGCSWGYSVRLPNVASVCSLIRVCRKLSLIVFDDVVRLIREAGVGVSVKCIAGFKKEQKVLSCLTWS